MKFKFILLGFGMTTLIIGAVRGNDLTILTGIVALCSAAIIDAIYSTNKS